MELSFWMPFSRLTYTAYLVHFSLIDVIMGEERTVYHYVNMTQAVSPVLTSYKVPDSLSLKKFENI